MSEELLYRRLFENGEKVAAMTAIYEQQNGLLCSKAKDRLAPLQAAIKEAGQSLQSRVCFAAGQIPTSEMNVPRQQAATHPSPECRVMSCNMQGCYESCSQVASFFHPSYLLKRLCQACQQKLELNLHVKCGLLKRKSCWKH